MAQLIRADEKDYRRFQIAGISPVGKKKKPRKKETGKPTLQKNEVSGENMDLLYTALECYENFATWRSERETIRKYHRGDQWHEAITDPDDSSETITEEQYIKNQGKIPLKQNLMRQIAKSILGQFRLNRNKTTVHTYDREEQWLGEVLTNAIRTVHEVNNTRELDVSSLMEFLISGMPVAKVTYSYLKEKDREDVFIRTPNPNRMFFNTDIEDIRAHKDLRIIGELHDVTYEELCAVFAKNDADKEILGDWYSQSHKEKLKAETGLTGFSTDRIDTIDFYNTNDASKLRVIEVWYLDADWKTYIHDRLHGTYYCSDLTMEEVEGENERRRLYVDMNGLEDDEGYYIEAERKWEQFWRVKWLTPHGKTLMEMDSPYLHQEHPYVIAPYPLIDGEVWGFLSDIKDQQRYINRLITLIDFIMGYSAKGVLFIFEDMIPEGMTEDDIAEEWSKFNGVVKLKKPKEGGDYPKQIHANSINIGAQELLTLQLKLINDISGVHSAIQGQEAKSGTPSSLYAQEAQNATINIKDMFDHFAFYQKQRDQKVLSVLRQFWTDKRMLSPRSVVTDDKAAVWDPERIRDVDYDLVVTQGQDTPVYRQIMDDMLFKLLEAQQIDIEMFLESSSVPFADTLLQQIRSKRQQLQQQGLPTGTELTPDMLAQAGVDPNTLAQQGGSPQANEMVQRLMQGTQPQG